MSDLNLQISESEPSQSELLQITDGLQSHGVKTGALELPQGTEKWYVKKDIYISYKDPKDDSKVVAGCSAYTVGGLLYTTLLWVDESMRGKGLGSKLLFETEKIAKGRGCDRAYLDTFQFQGPDFYPKLGYKVIHEVKGCFDGKTNRIFYEKHL